MSEQFEGPVGVISFEGTTICYGEKKVFHSAVGAGGIRIQNGTRLVAVVFGTSTELPIEGELKAAIDADVSKRSRRGTT